MSNTSLTVYGGFVLRSLAALLLFGVLRFFDRRYHKRYLQLWAWSWLAAAVTRAIANAVTAKVWLVIARAARKV